MQTDTDSALPQDVAPAPDLGGDDLRATLESALLGEPDTGPSSDSETSDPDEGMPAPETASQAPEGDGDSPPASWSKQAKLDWQLMPQRARDEIRKREHEIQSALSQTSEARKLQEQLTPYIEQMKQAGVEPAGYVENLLQWNAALRGQPAQAISALSQQFITDAQSARHVVQQIAQRFGLDEWDMGAGTRDDGVAPQQIISLEQRLRQQELQAAQREWADFSTAKTPDGKSLHPFADECKAEMADAIRANPRLSFAEAYERAKWINPKVRERILADEAQQRAKVGAQRAGKARDMALPRGRGGDGGIPSRDDLRADLREQLARAGARVSE
jgi:hypothetical protein